MQNSSAWVPDLTATTGPMYERIAQALSQDIRAGKLRPGDQLPPNRELAVQLGVTVGTVSRAFGEVLRSNLIETGARRGTRVKDLAAAELLTDETVPLAMTGHRIADLRGHQAALKDWGIDIGETLGQLQQSAAFGELLRYDDPAGRLAHRQAGAEWLSLNTSDPVDPPRVVVTDGAQHALLCGLMALVKSGDCIATERLTYTGLKTLAPLLGLELVPVDVDEQGMVPASLQEAITLRPVKAIVCVPNIHNPTTATMPLERRLAIAEIARQADIHILEDDVYGCLAETALATIASLAPERTIRITSFSKSLGPGLRVGYMETPRRLTTAVIEAVRATTWMASPISAEVATRLLLSGRAAKVLSDNRGELRQRNEALQTELKGFDLRSSPFSPHAWLTLPDPWTTSQFCRWAESMGYRVSGAESFAIGRESIHHAVRISVSAAQDAAELARFGQLAARALSRDPQLSDDGMLFA